MKVLAPFIVLCACALAFAAPAQTATYQPMASKALLDLRITEVNSNMNARLDALQKSLMESASNLLEVIKSTSAEQSAVDRQTSDVIAANLDPDTLWDTNVVYGVRIENDFAEQPSGLAVFDGVERSPKCYTNALTGAACWETATVADGATNLVFSLTTPNGESFTQTAASGSKYTLASATNAAYTVRIVTGRVFSEAARDIILRAE